MVESFLLKHTTFKLGHNHLYKNKNMLLSLLIHVKMIYSFFRLGQIICYFM